MTSSRPGRPNSTGTNAPPTSRRSARQQRLANREANRSLSRAGTSGSAGGGMGQIMLWTVAAVVVGAVVIGGAFLLTQKPSASPVGNPISPGVLTPTDIPQNGTTLGLADAKVTIDLWSDFRCTACFVFAVGSDTETKLINNYVRTGKAKLVYHDLIVVDLIQGHEGETESRDAANAALCATDQGKFWHFHDWLFANQSASESPGYFTIDRLLQIGQLANLDMSKFKPCVEQGSHLDQVKAELDQFHAAAPNERPATPTVLVGGVLVANPMIYANVAAAIDAALNPGASPSASASASAAASASASAAASASASAAASASASPAVTPTAKPS